MFHDIISHPANQHESWDASCPLSVPLHVVGEANGEVLAMVFRKNICTVCDFISKAEDLRNGLTAIETKQFDRNLAFLCKRFLGEASQV